MLNICPSHCSMQMLYLLSQVEILGLYLGNILTKILRDHACVSQGLVKIFNIGLFVDGHLPQVDTKVL